MNTKLSIVIPTRNELPCLWFTLQGLLQQRVDFNQIEVIVVDNEVERPLVRDKDQASQKMLKDAHFPKSQWLGADLVKSPYHPRNEGAKHATGEWLLFLDSHVLLCPSFLQHILDHLPSEDDTITHFPVSFGSPTLYGHYELRLGGDFWGGWKGLRKAEVLVPYRIAATGIWAFLVGRDYYNNVLEGFNPNFVGYGGGEPYLDLKCWMLGGSVWIDPRVDGVHYSGPRGYGQQWAERIRNFALAISVIDPKRISTHAAAMVEKSRIAPVTIEQFIQAGIKAGEDEAGRFRKRQKYSLDDVIASWRAAGVPF